MYDRNGEMNLFIADFDAAGRKISNERQITTGPGGDYQPTWSADQKSIAFFSRRSGGEEIWRLDLADGAKGSGPPKQLTKGGKNVNPAFSPDGAHIAFISDRTGSSELWVMDADGGNQRALSKEGAGGHYVRWLDAETVAYSGQHLFAAPLDGRPPRKLTDRGAGHLTFSPGGRFAADNNHTAVFVWPLTGGEIKEVFHFPDTSIGIDYTVWSPDGQMMLIDRNLPQGGDIYKLNNVE